MFSIHMAEKPLIQKLCEIYFSRVYMDKHEDEYRSTSPFATTQKIPSSRIETTPVTYTDIDPMNGQQFTTTSIVRDEIYKCPVTDKEFLEKTLWTYKSRIMDDAKRYGIEEASKLEYRQNFDVLSWSTRINNKTITLTYEKLIDFDNGRAALEAIEFIENELKG